MTQFRRRKADGRVFPMRGNVTIKAPKKGYISFANKRGDNIILNNNKLSTCIEIIGERDDRKYYCHDCKKYVEGMHHRC